MTAGLVWFEPWALWTDETVHAALPSASAPAAAPVRVARGVFVSHEHTTTGNGLDLHVLLSDAPVKEGTAGWRVFDDERHVDLARLKGNKGDQNYPLPTDVDRSKYPSVSIWCDRFDISFGAAAGRATLVGAFPTARQVVDVALPLNQR